MADDRIAGNPAAVTVTGNVISWAEGDWRRGVWEELFEVGDYVANVTDSSSQQITAIGGEQSDGSFEITVSDASGWSTDDECTPQRQSTIYQYNTPTLAKAGCSAGDSILLWYSDQSRSTDWLNEKMNDIGADAGPKCNLYGMAMDVTMQDDSYGMVDCRGDLDGASLEIKGVGIVGTNDAGAPTQLTFSNGTLVVDMSYFQGGNYCLYVNTTGSLTVRNTVLCNTKSYNLRVDGGANAQFDHCTFARANPQNINVGNETATFRNCVAFSGGSDAWVNHGNATGYNNAADDTSCTNGNWSTGSGNLPSQTRDDLFWHRDNANGNYYPIFGITEDSSLYHAGMDASCDYDYFGKPRHATTPSIGAVEGSNLIDTGGGSGPLVGPFG